MAAHLGLPRSLTQSRRILRMTEAL
jgi:hypothetical protein